MNVTTDPQTVDQAAGGAGAGPGGPGDGADGEGDVLGAARGGVDAANDAGTAAEAVEATESAPAVEGESEDRDEFVSGLNDSFRVDRVRQGELVKGTIVAVLDDVVLVSIGGKSEALMERAELEDAKVGDAIEAVVMETGQEVRLSRKLALGRRSQEQIRAAYEAGIAVEGKVTGKNKGGFEVKLGGLRAFCPLSQMGLGQGEGETIVGSTQEFKILELAEGGRRVVLSRIAVMRAENEAKAAELRAKLKAGDVLSGRVRSVTKFGVFVDVGGVEGLVHVSEISRRRVENPADVVKPGQDVQVKVLKHDPESKKLSLSMKELEADPWTTAAERFKQGDPFNGQVVRATDFGLFVELEPGLEGLVHVSQLPRGAKLGDESFAAGAIIGGFVREVDPGKRRVSLSMREVPRDDPWRVAEQRYLPGTMVEGTVDKVAPFGVFVQVEPGLVGLVPRSEIENAGVDLGKTFPVGTSVKLKVSSVDAKVRRMSLSSKEASKEEDRKDFAQYLKDLSRNAPKRSTSAFADVLRDALQKRKG